MDEDSDDDDDIDLDNGLDRKVKPKVKPAAVKNGGWNPITIQTVWKEDGKHTMCTLVIALPSGCVDKDEAVIRVTDDKMRVELKIKWPSYMADVKELHRFLGKHKLPPYHPRFRGFDEFFETKRRYETDDVEETITIKLPFKVMKEIPLLRRLGTKSGGRFIYMDLVAEETSSYKDRHDCDFEIF